MRMMFKRIICFLVIAMVLGSAMFAPQVFARRGRNFTVIMPPSTQEPIDQPSGISR